MKIVLAGYFSAFWHEEAWARALRDLGHKVVEFRIAPYVTGGLARRFQNRFLVGPIIEIINKDFFQTCVQNRPDVILCYRALPLRPTTIRDVMKAGDSIVVGYNNDNIFGALRKKAYWRHFRQTISSYDLNLVFRDSDVANYRSLTAKPVYVLRHHYLPWLHRPISQELFVKWKSDICFLGHCERDRRIHYMDALMKNLPAVYRLHGALWRENASGRAWKGMDTYEVQGEDYVKGLNGAKIALVFFSSLNADNYTTRVFEIPACGTFMLCPRTEIMLQLYEEDKEAVYFEDADELLDKARFYLKHDQIRERVAAAGRKRCLSSGYDIHSRMREWTNLIAQRMF